MVDAAGLDSARDGYTDHTELFDDLGVAIRFFAVHRAAARTVTWRMPRKMRKQLEDSACVSMASSVAEVKAVGRVTRGVEDDVAEAFACARMLGLRGAAIRRWVRARKAKARELLEDNWPAVEAIARRMLKRERVLLWREVSGDEVRRLLGRARG